MPLPNSIQFDIIIYSLLAGILIGILFDTYRVVRGTKGPFIIILIQDILFWVLTALIVFSFLLYINYAFLGPYVYLIMLLSLGIYFKLISLKIFKIESKIHYSLSKIIRILFKNIAYPFKLIYFNLIREGNKKK